MLFIVYLHSTFRRAIGAGGKTKLQTHYNVKIKFRYIPVYESTTACCERAPGAPQYDQNIRLVNGKTEMAILK